MTAHAPHAPAVSPTRESESHEVERYWWVFALAGLTSLVIGVLVIAYPDPSVKLLGVFLGIDLLVVAIGAIVRGIASLSHSGPGQGTLLLGIVGLIAGAIVIRNPGNTIVLLAVTLAIYLIVAGALSLADAIISSGHRMFSLVRGLVLGGAGTVMLCWPHPSLNALVILAGVSLCLQGVVELSQAYLLRAFERRPGLAGPP
jgi:uncharacterized membrane protein HdeD (DUF308 family)